MLIRFIQSALKKPLGYVLMGFILCLSFTKCCAYYDDWESRPGWSTGYVEYDHLKIFYIKNDLSQAISNNPTLLFIPGISMPSWIFEKQLLHFSKKYPVLAMDPHSQGKSTQTTEGNYAAAHAKDIRAVITQLKLKNVVLIGWSMAVTEILSYIEQFGTDNIVGIVLIDGFVGMDANSDTQKMMLSYWKEFQKDRVKNTAQFVQGLFRQPQSQEYLKNLTNASLVTPTNTFMTLLYNLLLTDYRPVLSTIKLPALVIGIDAPWKDDIKQIANLLPNSHFEVVPNAAHAVFVDQPNQFNQIVERFLSDDLSNELYRLNSDKLPHS